MGEFLSHRFFSLEQGTGTSLFGPNTILTSVKAAATLTGIRNPDALAIIRSAFVTTWRADLNHVPVN